MTAVPTHRRGYSSSEKADCPAHSGRVEQVAKRELRPRRSAEPAALHLGLEAGPGHVSSADQSGEGAGSAGAPDDGAEECLPLAEAAPWNRGPGLSAQRSRLQGNASVRKSVWSELEILPRPSCVYPSTRLT